jgi:hypothetical protein
MSSTSSLFLVCFALLGNSKNAVIAGQFTPISELAIVVEGSSG